MNQHQTCCCVAAQQVLAAPRTGCEWPKGKGLQALPLARPSTVAVKTVKTPFRGGRSTQHSKLPLRGSDVARNPDQHHDRIRPAYQVDSLEAELERTIAGDHGARGLAASRQRMPERNERDSINSAPRVRDWAPAFVISAPPTATLEVPAAPCAQRFPPPVHLTPTRTGAERPQESNQQGYCRASTKPPRPDAFETHLELWAVESSGRFLVASAADSRPVSLPSSSPPVTGTEGDEHDADQTKAVLSGRTDDQPEQQRSNPDQHAFGRLRRVARRSAGHDRASHGLSVAHGGRG
jgi:hypothetical protein